jgi:hypothetical protein
LAIAFHGHLDSYHRGAAEVRVAVHRTFAAHGVDPILLEIAPWFNRDSRFFLAVVLRLELLLEVSAQLVESYICRTCYVSVGL